MSSTEKSIRKPSQRNPYKYIVSNDIYKVIIMISLNLGGMEEWKNHFSHSLYLIGLFYKMHFYFPNFI